MNKNISIALHVLTVLAVAVLYFMHFNCSKSCKAPVAVADETAPATTSESEETLEEEPAEEAEIIALPTDKAVKGLAYVNSDSLMSGFVYYQNVKKQLEGKRSKLEKAIEGKTEAMQKEYMGYQQRGASMTQKEMEDAERSLMTKQQDLVQYREVEAEKLFKEEEKYNRELLVKVNSFLKEYAAQKGYSLILSYSEVQSAVLYGEKSMDITKEVIKGLNAREKK